MPNVQADRRTDNVQTTVRFPDGWLQVLRDMESAGMPHKQASIGYTRDVISKEEYVTVYSDDGRGNGVPICQFLVA